MIDRDEDGRPTEAFCPRCKSPIQTMEHYDKVLARLRAFATGTRIPRVPATKKEARAIAAGAHVCPVCAPLEVSK